jgi:hypothetical protein
MTRTRRTCTVPGCQRPHWAHGYCNLHGLRVQRHGNPGPVDSIHDDPQPLDPARLGGITYRQIDHWARVGYLHPQQRHGAGSGRWRHWPDDEAEVAYRMVRLVTAGIPPALAATIARADGPVEIAPGITITIDPTDDPTPPPAPQVTREDALTAWANNGGLPYVGPPA